MFLFLKAIIPGAAKADLFGERVQVEGHTTKQGTWVAPHQATRYKRRKAPLTPEHARLQGDLFSAKPAAKPKPATDPRQVSLFDAPEPQPAAAVETPAPPPAPEPEPEPAAPVAAKPVPDAIRNQVRRAITALEEVQDALDQGRATDQKFQGQGRYEADAWSNSETRRTAALNLLAKFREKAAALGIDPEAVIAELGGAPDVALSPAGQAYADGSAKPAEDDRAKLRRLYREACHGADAEPRLKARAEIEKMAEERGQRLGEMFDAAGLDIGAYFASRPIVQDPPKPKAEEPAATPVPEPEKPAEAPKATVTVADAVEAAMPGVGAMMRDLLGRFAPGVSVDLVAHTDAAGRLGYIEHRGGTKFYMELNTAAKREPQGRLRTLLHETGHIIAWTRLAEADDATRGAILRQWQKERPEVARLGIGVQWGSAGHLGTMEAEGSARTASRVDAGLAGGKGEYWRAFNEWAAEKAAYWLAHDAKPQGVVEQFFADLATALRATYAGIAKLLGIEPKSGALEKLLAETWDTPIRHDLTDLEREWWVAAGLMNPGQGVPPASAAAGVTPPAQPTIPPEPESSARPAVDTDRIVSPVPPGPASGPTEWAVPPGTSQKDRKALNAEALRILGSKRDDEMTEADRQALARYTGRGGIGDSLNEFYTDPAVATAMWDLLRSAGFQGGDVLEPSCGTGVFLHTAPEGARVTGVEMAPTSARIASILHGPAGHEVRNASLERFATQDGRKFKAVIGNVPFCQRGKLIKEDKPDLTRAEQYFLDTALDLTEDGGLVALVVPTGIMDGSNNRSFRERVLRKGEFLGAVRLPNTAFEAAHTSVTSDIVLFRKRPQEVAGALGALDQDQLRKVGVWDADFLGGGYFTDGRGGKNVLGKLEEGWRTKAGIGDDITVTGSMDGVPAAISAFQPEPAAASLTVPAILESLGADAAARQRVTSAALKEPYQQAKPGDVRVIDGVRYILTGEPPRWHRADEEMPAAVEDALRVAEMLGDLRDGRVRDPKMQWVRLIEALDSWVAAHGAPHQNRELRKWLASPAMRREDGVEPEDHAHHVRDAQRRVAGLLGAVNNDGSYSDLVTGREREREAADLGTVGTKLALEGGGFTADQLASAAGAHRDAVLDHLHASADFALESDGQTWTTTDNYLSGELWPKLDAAKAAAEDPAVPADLRAKYAAQAKRLEETIDPQSLEDVEVGITSGFVTPEDLTAWLADRRAAYLERNRGQDWPTYTVSYEPGAWDIRSENNKQPYYGDEEVVLRYLNRDRVKKDEKDKVERLNREFKEWALGSDRRNAIEERYNRQYRGFRQREYSNSPIHIPGMNTAGLKDYQYGGVRWALAAGKGIIAADVGLGKTARGLMLAKVAKQTGQAKKPTFVVPKSVLANWMREAERWFPGSRVLVIGETYSTGKDGQTRSKPDDAATRRQKLHQLQQNDWDFVFISQPAWNDIDISPELKDRYEGDDFWTQRGDKLEGAKSKAVAKARESFEQNSARREFTNREDTIYFDKLGVDMLLADEGHQFKNLFAVRNRFGQSPKFLGGGGQSKRAKDTNHKARALREANGGKGVFMLTATPTKNSPLEVYSMLSHIAPEAFERMGIKNSEEFLDRFCEFETRNVLGTDGMIEEALVTKGFKNLDELREVMKRYIDRKTAEDVGLELPRRDDKQHLVDMTDAQEAKYAELRELASKDGKGDDSGDAHIFSIMDKMGKATIDLGLLDPAHAGERSPKIERCAKEAAKLSAEGGQIIFCESIPTHDRIVAELVKAGVPRDAIAVLNGQTAPSSADRQKISDAFNSGRVKVVVANKVAEEGVNLQMGTSDIHHLDLPWEPASLQQRNGRGLRQGNTQEAVRLHTYLARGSFDGYRWQTIAAKKDWQDLLWNGGDRVENLALEGGLSRDEMLIMLSADPDAARKKYEDDKVAAEARQKAEHEGKAVDMFGKFQEMTKSLGELKAKGVTGAAVARLEHRSRNLKEILRDNKWFAHKRFLDSSEPVFIEPTTNTAWTKGMSFELAGGSEGPCHWSDTPTRWVVEGLKTGDDGQTQIVARLYGKTTRREMDAARFKAGVTPMPYSKEEEDAAIAGDAAALATKKAAAVESYKALKEMPAVALEARRAEIQAKLKEGIRAHKVFDLPAEVPLVGHDGSLSIVPSYKLRTELDHADLILPTPKDRAKAIEGYIREGEGRRIKSKESAAMQRRRSTSGYRAPEYDGIVPHHGEDILGTGHNRWAAALRDLFGPEAEAEAKAELKRRGLEKIAGAGTFAEAMRAASPLLNLPGYGGRVSVEGWPEDVARALRDKAAALGALDQPLREAAPADASGSYRPGFIHHDLFRVAFPDGEKRKVWNSGASGYGRYSSPREVDYQPTVQADSSWTVGRFLNRRLGEPYQPPEAPPAPAPPPAPEPAPEAPAPAPPAASPEHPAVVEHTTAKGKVLRGIVRRDLTFHQAKEIDPYTFKKDGGLFIRLKHVPGMEHL